MTCIQLVMGLAWCAWGVANPLQHFDPPPQRIALEQLLEVVMRESGVVLPLPQTVQLGRGASAVPLADQVPTGHGWQSEPPKPARQAAEQGRGNMFQP